MNFTYLWSSNIKVYLITVAKCSCTNMNNSPESVENLCSGGNLWSYGKNREDCLHPGTGMLFDPTPFDVLITVASHVAPKLRSLKCRIICKCPVWF